MHPVPAPIKNSCARLLVFCILAAAGEEAALGGERVRFFASRSACAASGVISRQDCDNAFANAANEMRFRLGEPTDRMDCVVRFKLCEKSPGAESPSRYVPVMLGVELERTRAGWTSRPVLATEMPREQAFHAHPVSRLADPEQDFVAKEEAPPSASQPASETARPGWLDPLVSDFDAKAPPARETENDRKARERRREQITAR